MPWDCETSRQRYLRKHGGKSKFDRERRMRDPRQREITRLRGSQRYVRFRAAYMGEHPVCELCKPEGRTRASRELDHITALRRYPVASIEAACFDEDNVQALCISCHAAKSGREQAEDRRRERGDGNGNA